MKTRSVNSSGRRKEENERRDDDDEYRSPKHGISVDGESNTGRSRMRS
jgi:hypothetical protein